MKRFIYILSLIAIIIISLTPVYSHSDFWVKREYGNVLTRFKTGFNYEEISKALIIGKLAERLSNGLNYSGKIFLDFKHHYTNECEPAYFISYDKGGIEFDGDSDDKEKDYLDSNALVIRQINKKFDVITTLKLVEYSILNLSMIKKHQKSIVYNKNYCLWKINSIDTSLIKLHLNNPNSELVNNLFKVKVERPDDNFKYGFSYYWQENKFHLFFRDIYDNDKTLLSIDNVYDFREFDGISVIIFDSDSSFFYINQNNRFKLSQKHVIKETHNFYMPFKIENIGGEKISIFFWYFREAIESGSNGLTTNRTLIYLTDKDELIQDLDEVINNYKNNKD